MAGCQLLHLHWVFGTGIWLHHSGVLAASPDGIVLQSPAISTHGVDFTDVPTPYLLEVKCPYGHRNNTVLDAATSKDFFLGIYSIYLSK